MTNNHRSNLTSRRRFLKTTGAIAGVGVAAGCSGDGSDTPTGGDDDTGGSTPTTSRTETLDTFTNEGGYEVGSNFEAIQELAQDEGSMTMYAVYDRGPMQNWIEAFREEYPSVTINHITGGAGDLASRWDSEYRSNNVVASMFGSSASIQQVWNNGQALELTPELLPAMEEMPDQFQSDDGYWVATDLSLGSIFYNTDMVEEDALSTWSDAVTDDQWADQSLGWDPTPNLYLMSWLLETQGREFFENLHDQRPRFVDSHTDLARFCGAGEFPITFTYTHKMGEFGNELPIDYFPFDPQPAQITPAVVNNKAPEPNSVLLFLNWLISEDGQQVMGESPYIPYHPDVGYQSWDNLYPSDQYDVDIISPEADIEAAGEMWDEVMGDLVG